MGANVILQIVSIVFGLYLLIFTIMTTFSYYKEPTAQESTQRSVSPVVVSESPHSANSIPRSESFLDELRIRAKQINLNLAKAEQYCLPPTSLANCELDWHKLKLSIGKDSRFGILDPSYAKPNYRNDQCFVTAEEITCFRPSKGTHSEVRLDKFGFKPQGGIHKFDYTRVIIYALHIVPIDPYRYILVKGVMPLQFCWFSLLGHGGTCRTY